MLNSIVPAAVAHPLHAGIPTMPIILDLPLHLKPPPPVSPRPLPASAAAVGVASAALLVTRSNTNGPFKNCGQKGIMCSKGSTQNENQTWDMIPAFLAWISAMLRLYIRHGIIRHCHNLFFAKSQLHLHFKVE